MTDSVLDCETLNGELYKWERADQKHLRHAFGYWNMVERRMVRALAAVEGRTLSYMEENRAIEANHKNDPTHAQRCAARQAAAPPAVSNELTAAEWSYLRDLLEFANDPTARIIFTKALAH